MNKWRKGSQVESLYCKKLQASGFDTYRAPKAKFNQQDIFGCDIVAIRVGELRFIQVKSCADRFPAFLKKTKRELYKLYLTLPLSEKCRVFWAGYNSKKKEWKEIEITDKK